MTDINLPLTRKIQLKQLEIMKVFQDICRRHNLRHFVIGGTCLGAVRHKGFIPWDDDVDYIIPFEDCVKFMEAAKTELPANYALYGHRCPRLYNHAYALRLHDTNTTYVRKDAVNIRDWGLGVHIDILIANGLPPEPERKKTARLSLMYERLNYILRMPNISGIKWKLALKKIINIILIPARMVIPYDYFLTKMEKLLSKYPFDCSDKIIFPWTNGGKYRQGLYRNVFCYDDFRSVIEMPFEDITVPVPVGYDNFLRMEYGDYMTLPPESKRVPENAVNIVDLERPYTYYLDQAGAK